MLSVAPVMAPCGGCLFPCTQKSGPNCSWSHLYISVGVHRLGVTVKHKASSHRSNLDPFDCHTDKEIWAALERTFLTKTVSSYKA